MQSNLVGVSAPELEWGAKTRQNISSSTSHRNGEVVKAMTVNPVLRRASVPKQSLPKASVPDEAVPRATTAPQLAGLAGTVKEEPRAESHAASAKTGFVDRDNLPESLAFTLDYIVGQVCSLD